MPDVAGEKAASSILDIAEGLGPDDLCLALMSGCFGTFNSARPENFSFR